MAEGKDQMILPMDGLGPSRTDAAQEVMAFVLRMRARRISDTAVLRALETVPRDKFVPHRYVDMALRDVALPIGCGQTMPEPWLVARMMEALAVSKKHRVLEIGAGSGYATAILARLAGEVLSLERFRSLALESASRLLRLGISNAIVLHADGLTPPDHLGLFDRILIHIRLDSVPDRLMSMLASGGSIVFPQARPRGRSVLLRMTHSESKGFQQAEVCECRATPPITGLSAIL
jgi:protein-L-isoaspartate(D-aspartate) O-methyltransferase